MGRDGNTSKMCQLAYHFVFECRLAVCAKPGIGFVLYRLTAYKLHQYSVTAGYYSGENMSALHAALSMLYFSSIGGFPLYCIPNTILCVPRLLQIV